MAKRPPEHANDGIATDELRKILPKPWIYKSPRDAFGGFEYGEDWLVEIVEKDNPTGVEFCVQNKVTSKVAKRRISVAIEVDTLHRLHALGRPVLLHIFSSTDSQSYWMWLEDFYAQNQAKWKRKKQVSVSIPARNMLTTESIEQIREYAAKFHRQQSFLKRYSAISRTDPDYKLQLVVDDEKELVVIQAKHDKPRPMTITFTDSENAKLFRESLETGVRGHVLANIELSGIIEPGAVELTIFPHVSEASFPQKIEMFSANGEKLCEIPYLNMKLTREGSIQRTWEGVSQTLPVTVIITHNQAQKGFNVKYDIDLDTRNPLELRSRFAFVDCFTSCDLFRLVYLETGESIEIPQNHSTVIERSLIDQSYRELVDFLATIADKLHIMIEIPDEVSGQEMTILENICNVLNTGVYYDFKGQKRPQLLVQMQASTAQKLLSDIQKGDSEGTVEYKGGIMTVEILGHKIELGPVVYVFHEVSLVDVQDLERQLQGLTEDSADMVEFRCNFDNEHSYTKFLNWFHDPASS